MPATVDEFASIKQALSHISDAAGDWAVRNISQLQEEESAAAERIQLSEQRSEETPEDDVKRLEKMAALREAAGQLYLQLGGIDYR
eukprot:CAMPEP_0174854594 /NCGR_PEP_ID=MMETSP1114-20130205/31766_1 /TAXON_ID=312471 /ORGANISM="Neobodo designis, Strain CCAP 1951/1" /LENGTH=85 /DNA_ID=CAMNT_0016089297 /DNA_START=43 /DNA_END=297 /DNA_ORIENTATION=+